MAIEGSAARLYKKQLATIPGLMFVTAEQSLSELRDTVRKHTPVGRTGHLRESIEKTHAKREGDAWTGQVSTDVYYAAAVEYGTSAHVIKPKNAEALKIGPNFAEEAHIPSHVGAHMFQKGAAEFIRLHASEIADRNLSAWAKG